MIIEIGMLKGNERTKGGKRTKDKLRKLYLDQIFTAKHAPHTEHFYPILIDMIYSKLTYFNVIT